MFMLMISLWLLHIIQQKLELISGYLVHIITACNCNNKKTSKFKNYDPYFAMNWIQDQEGVNPKYLIHLATTIVKSEHKEIDFGFQVQF
jgi:hypothetical protein